MTVVARLNGRFLLWFIVLLPLTLGVGSAILWLRRRFSVYQVDEAGVTLWAGRNLPWRKVRNFHFRKRMEGAGPRITRVDIQFEVGRGFIAPEWLANGDELVQAFRAGVRDGLPERRLRSNYTQRR
ncbi:hypothetical protein EV667_1708 [Ancylobacter aquaticus]|uniref:Uncharacterized protein n=2 Tax=Ancylobacter aquaticus TaxID=100 RepID=A0A4R1I835_ANCAQ|nr:hypothetical protein EV667_1708 [Ancylobacter aquaticus]